MLDLKKIALSLRKTLANETTETIDKWFEDYDNNLIKTNMKTTKIIIVDDTIWEIGMG